MDPQEVFQNALILRRQHGWAQAKIDKYVQEQTGLPDLKTLAAALAQQGRAEDLGGANSPEAPSLAGSIATKFGQGASLGFSDELSGLIAALASLGAGQPGGAPTGQNPIDAYTAARDENRNYLAAASAAHPTASRASELLGGFAGGAVAPVGAAARDVGLVPAIAKGMLGAGIVGGVAATGYAPKLNADALPDIAKQAAQSAVLGGVLTGAGRGIQDFLNPAADRVTNAMERSEPLSIDEPQTSPLVPSPAALASGTEALAAEHANISAQSGRTPMMAELSPEMAQEATKYVPRVSATAREAARRAVQQQLDAEMVARRGIESDPTRGYAALPADALHTPQVMSRVQQIVTSPVVAKYVKQALSEGVEPPTTDVTPQSLNWLRKQLREGATNAFNAGKNELGARLRDASIALGEILKENVPGFMELQAQVGQHLRREDTLGKMLKAMGGQTARGRLRPNAGESITGFVRRGLGLDPYDQAARAARDMVPILLRPQSFQDMMRSVRGLRWKLPVGLPGALLGAQRDLNDTTDAQP